MATSHYARGVAVEHRLKGELEAEGYHVVRASSSKGHFDLIAMRHDRVIYASCKRATTWTIAKRTARVERRRLLQVPLPPGPTHVRLLAVWVDEDARGKKIQSWFLREELDDAAKTAETA